jgi:hypothetical protein
MIIYDCFTFYNEFDLLELRFKELYDHVDYFVIVEADRTFTNRIKPFHFQQHRDRYARWEDKIIYHTVSLPGDPDAWVNERFQRNSILDAVRDVGPDDLIVISDVDEIPRAAAVDYMRTSGQTVYALRMPIYNFKFNYMKLDPDRYNIWAMAARRAVFRGLTPDQLRNMRFNFFGMPYQHQQQGFEVVEHGGWHFGYMGNTEYLVDKAQSFSHTEVNRPDFINQIDPEASIQARTSWDRNSADKYEIVAIDEYLPQAVTDYPDRLIAGATVKAIDLLPKYAYN